MRFTVALDNEGVRQNRRDRGTDNGIILLVFDHIAHAVKLRRAQFGRLQVALHMNIEEA